MDKYQSSYLVVVQDNGALFGILTYADLLQYPENFNKQNKIETTIAAYCSRSVTTVDFKDIEQAHMFMLSKKISHPAVVERNDGSCRVSLC